MAKGVFITGTDTGVGKTWFTLALMEALKKQGYKTNGMKPVASGGNYINDKLGNEDARLILQHCSEPISYEHINPFVFEPPIAPNFAAKQAGKVVELDRIVASYNQLASVCDNIVVEGIGGWRVPLSDKITTVDLVRELELPVILVVGLRLGCLNHAILTAEAIRADGVNLRGWVSNQLDKDYRQIVETVGLLNEKLACPNIANLDYMIVPDPTGMCVKIDPSFIVGL
ncbi:MAG: ATP-dependent dethiobiotin synthetase BioD [marine bacterium B5-7]|nr:MAG: ATP-dependent dethiobiotin synthetase BioD [marine bacterium B5-7]